MNKTAFRFESDSMGEMRIPADRLWGAQTQRAIINFPISNIKFPVVFIQSLGLIKLACAQANLELGDLDEKIGSAIIRSAREVSTGVWDDHFPLDIFQTGSGTSTNMNANEVIANRANIILGGEAGARSPVHPNDHVNRSQSSNDIIPTAIHVAAVMELQNRLRPALDYLLRVLREKSEAFSSIVKTGRTHLQDATPVTMGQVFSGYATQVRKSIDRLDAAVDVLREVALGGTAVGTGVNRRPEFPETAITILNGLSGERFRKADNAMEANAARDGLVEASGELRTIALSLSKIGEDIRWMGSGPRNGLGELKLPEVQPGSSIMPGKVNPVIIESLLMVCAQVLGNDLCMTIAGMGSHFELNMMMPLMAHSILQSTGLMAAAVENVTDRCIRGLEADTEQCLSKLDRNLALATGLAPVLGYDKAGAISKQAYATGRTIREVAKEMSDLSDDDLDRLLDPQSMTGDRV